LGWDVTGRFGESAAGLRLTYKILAAILCKGAEGLDGEAISPGDSGPDPRHFAMTTRPVVPDDCPVPSYDDWIRWLLDPTTVQGEELHDSDVFAAHADKTGSAVNSNCVVAHMKRLCVEIPTLCLQHDLGVIGQLLDKIVFSEFGFNWHEYLLDGTVRHSDRLECIGQMYDVFASYGTRASVDDDALFMWWDVLSDFPRRSAEDYQTEEAFLSLDLVRRDVLHAEYEVMCRTLDLGSIACIRAALHGLNHSRFPTASKTVQQFIDNNVAYLEINGILDCAIFCRDGRYQ